MRIFNRYFGIILSFLLFLPGCNKNEEASRVAVEAELESALYFYNKGLDTRDPEEKLQYYNKGLKAVNGINDTMLVSLLEGKVYALFRKGEFEGSVKWIDSLIKASEFQKDTFFLAKGYYRRSTLHNILNEPDLAFENSFIARQLNLKSGDTALAARRSFDMANAQIEMGDYTGSQVSATEAIKYLNPESDSIFISAAYNLIGLAYLDQGFYDDAINEYKNALKFAVRKKDSLTFQHNIAITLKNQGKYDDALEILESLVKSNAPDSISKSRFIDNLAFAYWTKDSTAQIDSLLFKAVEMRKRINDIEGLHSSYYHLAEYYESQDKSKAIYYAELSLEAAREVSAHIAELKALKKLISLVDINKKAKYVERYISLDDSLDKASAKAKFHFAKVRFDEEQKEEEIFQLEVKNFNQALEAERLKNRNIIFLLSILLVLLLGSLQLYNFRQRSKRERIQEIYLTESRISKRIHDELANDVYNLMSIFEAQENKEMVHKLDRIYRRTRDISRETAQIDTGKNFDKALISNLSSNAGSAKLILRGEATVNWEKVAEEKKIVIYRVLQELLVNMKKHSQASLVAIIFNLNGKQLEINYSDNGSGMEQESTRYGNGLMNIENRLKKIDGKIIYDTAPGRGFKASITLPI